MSIASELTNLEGNIEDSYDAVNDMGGIIPAQRNMDNLDQAIRTIPQNQGTTYTAGTGIDITSDVISVDNTTVPYFSDLATVATTGDYEDLLNTPTIPAAQVNSDWNANSGVAQILNKPSLATVATSGLYSDLTGTPSLATVATSGDYDDLLNKPTIPTVNDATLTIQHNGTNVQTFTANQGTNATANVETIYADPIASSAAITPLVQTSMIADGAVTTDKLGASAVTSAKITDGAVTADKISWATVGLYNFSATETVIGAWINGKPLYRRVFDTGTLPNNTTKSIAHGISNLKNIIHIYGAAKNTSNGITFPLPFPSTQANAPIYVYADNYSIVIGTATDRTVFTESYIVLEYTKTTD